MKLLLLHARSFRILPRSPSNRPKDIKPAHSETAKSNYVNTLIAFVCVEASDISIDAAAKEVLLHAERIGSPPIVVVPFAHLSSNLKPPLLAVKLLDCLHESLQASYKKEVFLERFGYRSQVFIESFSHPLAVAFRSIG
jgi:threonyl-tRNA synthetase